MIRPHSFLLAGACAALPVLALLACSGDDEGSASKAPDAGTDASPRRPPGPPDEDADAGIEAGRPPPPVLPGCIGPTSIPLVVNGERAYVSIALGAGPDAAAAPKGNFLVDFGTTGSTIDLAAFADGGAPAPTSCNGDAAAPGADCTFNGFDFFGDWGFVTLRTGDYSILTGTVRQAGIVATDFLARFPFTLEYTNKRMWKSPVSTFCTDTQLLGAGFVPLPSQGFYATDLAKLRPLSDVLKDPDAGTAGFTVANVPTVPIRIAGVSALAQLDTGYDDNLERHSINVNDALFDLIQKQDATLLTRAGKKDVFATTCVPGLSEKLMAYDLAPGRTVEFVAEGGSIARTEATAVIYVKPRTPETSSCGGVSTWTVPAAQVGSSFYVDAQAIVFDPATSRVWVPKN